MVEVPGVVPGRLPVVGGGAADQPDDPAPGGPGGDSDSSAAGSDAPGDLLAVVLCRRQLFPSSQPSTGGTRGRGTDLAPVATRPVHTQLGKGGLKSANTDHRPVSDSAIGAGGKTHGTTVGTVRRSNHRVRHVRRGRSLRTKGHVATGKPTAIALGGFSGQAGKFGGQAAKIAVAFAPLVLGGFASVIAAFAAWRYTQRRTWRHRAERLTESVT